MFHVVKSRSLPRNLTKLSCQANLLPRSWNRNQSYRKMLAASFSQDHKEVSSFLTQNPIERKNEMNGMLLSEADSSARRDLLNRLYTASRFGQQMENIVTKEWKYQENRELLNEWEASQDVSPKAVTLALRVLLRCRYNPIELSNRLQSIEKLVGSRKETPFTENLSLALLKANAFAGHVGRTLQLLGLRKKHGFNPILKEFEYAVRSIHSAGWENRLSRNILESHTPLDDPTRFLDAILLNMHQRQFALTHDLAHDMLSTFASSPMAKALHFHYRVVSTENGPRILWQQPPPYYKVPSKLTQEQAVALPGSTERMTKLEFERTEQFHLSPALSFLESLLQGACGHAPISLSRDILDTKINICCYRGAIWHAMDIVDREMRIANIKPGVFTYLKILRALARLGDIVTMENYYTQMVQEGLTPSRHVFDAMVSGYLNNGDISGAITFVQNTFNEYTILPSYDTHLKILELALGTENVYEAKRHVYFIQQLWRFRPNKYHCRKLTRKISTTVSNPLLSKESLKKLFHYFGFSLEEEDFFHEFRERKE